MRIQRTINAIIGATKDRRDIRRGAKHKLEGVDLQFYNELKSTSGPSVHNPVKVAKSWYKAYNENIKKLKLIEELNKPFKKPSLINQIFHRLTRK